MSRYRLPRNWRRISLSRLLPYSRWGMASRIIRRGNAVREDSHYLAAAILYEEAAKLTPRDIALHIQCGHMLKEAGEFSRAEEHYLAALALGGGDADLFLQMGHFYKVAGRPDEAAAAYARAARLAPDWPDPVQELAALGRAADEFPADTSAAASNNTDVPLPELLASNAPAPRRLDRDMIHIRQLGRCRPRNCSGAAKTLSGIEAIRGFGISAAAMVELRILIADQEVYRGTIASLPQPGEPGGGYKTPFNIWIDVTSFVPGKCRVDIQLLDARRHVLRHRQQVAIVEPPNEADHPGADAIVTVTADRSTPLERLIRARPSMARPARRSLLPRPPRAVLVQRVDQLGDLVVSIPAIRRLREMFAEARLVGLLSRANADFAATLGLFDDIVMADLVEDPRTGKRTLPPDRQRQLREQLAPFAFDIAIDLSEDAALRPLLLLSGAKFLHGFGRREFPWLNSDVEGSTPDVANALEVASHGSKLIAMVDWLGGVIGGHHRPIPPPAIERRRLTAYGIEDGDRYVLLHSGARLSFSRWPHYPALVKLLLERTQLKVLMLNDDPADAAGLQRQITSSDRLRIVTGRLPFADFDALLSFCAVFVGNDSGPKHLAAVRGAKVISIHMARLNWSEWGQEGDGVILSRRVPCAGCAIHHQPEECAKDFACISDISPEEVFRAADTYLEGAA